VKQECETGDRLIIPEAFILGVDGGVPAASQTESALKLRGRETGRSHCWGWHRAGRDHALGLALAATLLKEIDGLGK